MFLYADSVFSVCLYGPAVRRGLNSCLGGYSCHGRRKQASPYHGGTGPAFDGYKAAKYSRKYLAEHEAELADYRAAKATMAELLGGEKLPKMDVLKEKRRQLAARKKALYLEYRKAQQDMRELVAVKGSVDHLRGLTNNQRNKEQAR